MDFSTGAHVPLNYNHPNPTSFKQFKPHFQQFTYINPLPHQHHHLPTEAFFVISHTAASFAGEAQSEAPMASGHPHPGTPHAPPHPHPHPHPSSHAHHHDGAVPNISTASATVASSAVASATTTCSIAPPANPIAATTTNHSSHPPQHANVAVAPTNSQIPHIRLMCSYGGRILPRPGDHLLRYVGGETRIVSFPRTASFSTLVSLLSSLSPSHFNPKSPPIIKYQLPHEDLDSLISLCSDEDLINMLDEIDRLNPASKSPRLRLFLFPSSQGAFGSVLSTAEPNQWFLDALNSASPAAVGAALERRRSEASSSMVSDQPDYLTGIDTSSERYSDL